MIRNAAKHLLSVPDAPEPNPDAVSALAKLVSWFKFDEESGTRYDSYGSNHLDGVNHEENMVVVTGVPGSGFGISFGINSSLERAGVDCVGLDDASVYEILTWAKSSDSPGELWSVVSKTETSTVQTRGYAFNIGRNDTDPNKGKHMKGRSVSDPVVDGIPVGTWNLYSAYRDNTDRGIAIDAGTETVTETGATTSNSTADSFLIGPRTSFDHWSGTYVGQTAFFNDKLTQAEREYLYNGGSGRTLEQFLVDAGA